MSRKEVQDLLSSNITKVFFSDLVSDREALESAAMQAVCACRYYDLADTLHETPDEDLLAIVVKADPCEICGE